MSELAVEDPVNLAHLARYTGGDRSLNCEIFRLFSDQCRQSLRALEAALDRVDGKRWRQTVHALKGAAAGVGAFGLAETAGTAEGVEIERDPANAANVLAALATRSEVVLTFIGAYLAVE